jgi:O-acetyl-ADP-ribose deacetylase (regulator of RNase III)
MKRSIIHADITKIASDAMIYSTNVRLTLTGGVGAALFREFGVGIQIDLQSSSLGTGRELAEVGDVFETHIPESPWKRVFHTIATTELYHTDRTVVENILRRCFKRCVAAGDLRSVTCSALGTGYGDLELYRFLAACNLVCTEFDDSPLEEFAIVIHAREEFDLLVKSAKTLDQWNVKLT